MENSRKESKYHFSSPFPRNCIFQYTAPGKDWLVCLVYALSSRETSTYVRVWAHLPQSSLTLCAPVDNSLPGSSLHGILQTEILEWVIMTYSRGLLHPEVKLASPSAPALRWILYLHNTKYNSKGQVCQ